MNRYKKANEGIHAPEILKESVVRQRKPTYAKWVSAVAAVLVVALVAGILLWPGNAPVARAAGVIAEAEYPDMPEYPREGSIGFDKAYDEWRDDLRERRKMAPERDALKDFCAAAIPEFLGDSEGENRVFSPLNVYMALAMLAETCDGNSRAQILDLLGVSDIDALRDLSYRLWNSNYRDDGAATSVLASSLWLSEDIPFVQETMDRLADTYYASSYSGEMGSKEFNKALQDWLNEQTGGLLEDTVRDVEMTPDTILALATTLYFRVKWANEFREDRNTEDVFHGADGDRTVTFMNQGGQNNYYWADRFAAYGKHFVEGGAMWFLLPDEGVSVDEVLADSQTVQFLTNPNKWENSKYLIVNFSMPKFDVSSSVDLSKGLKELGVTDVFDYTVSDFTPMTTAMDEIFISRATHAARVVVDEEGVEAAAFTAMLYAGAGAPPEEEVDFVLDRPFIFAITGETGQLLFVGVVNRV